MPSSNTWTIECIFRGETDAAVQIIDPASDELLWIPLSQVESMVRRPDNTGSITMTRWIAEKKGLL